MGESFEDKDNKVELTKWLTIQLDGWPRQLCQTCGKAFISLRAIGDGLDETKNSIERGHS